MFKFVLTPIPIVATDAQAISPGWSPHSRKFRAHGLKHRTWAFVLPSLFQALRWWKGRKQPGEVETERERGGIGGEGKEINSRERLGRRGPESLEQAMFSRANCERRGVHRAWRPRRAVLQIATRDSPQNNPADAVLLVFTGWLPARSD